VCRSSPPRLRHRDGLRWIKALEYLFKAAERADRLAADEEALTLYRAAIETAERHGVKELDAGEAGAAGRQDWGGTFQGGTQC
jgi:hypothetical protein